MDTPWNSNTDRVGKESRFNGHTAPIYIDSQPDKTQELAEADEALLADNEADESNHWLFAEDEDDLLALIEADWFDIPQEEIDRLLDDPDALDAAIAEEAPEMLGRDVNHAVWQQIEAARSAETEQPQPLAATISAEAPQLDPVAQQAEEALTRIRSNSLQQGLVLILILLAAFGVFLLLPAWIIETDPRLSFLKAMVATSAILFAFGFRDVIASAGHKVWDVLANRLPAVETAYETIHQQWLFAKTFNALPMTVATLIAIATWGAFINGIVNAADSAAIPASHYPMVAKPTAETQAIAAVATVPAPATPTPYPTSQPVDLFASDTNEIVLGGFDQTTRGGSHANRSVPSPTGPPPTATQPAIILPTAEPPTNEFPPTELPSTEIPSPETQPTLAATPLPTQAIEQPTAQPPTTAPPTAEPTLAPTVVQPTQPPIVEATPDVSIDWEVALMPTATPQPTATSEPTPPPPLPTPPLDAVDLPQLIDNSRCPAPTSAETIVIQLNTIDSAETAGKVIRSDRSEAKATQTVAVTLAAGTYRVQLFSFDNHASSAEDQPNERWFLRFGNGAHAVASSAIADLPTERNSLFATVDEALTLDSAVSQISAVHAAYPDASSPNSVVPVCVHLERLP